MEDHGYEMHQVTLYTQNLIFSKVKLTQFKGQGGHLTRHFITDILSPDSPLNLSTTNKEEEAEEMRKKPRTSFNGWQIYELEKLFEEKKYINNEERKTFAR